MVISKNTVDFYLDDQYTVGIASDFYGVLSIQYNFENGLNVINTGITEIYADVITTNVSANSTTISINGVIGIENCHTLEYFRGWTVYRNGAA